MKIIYGKSQNREGQRDVTEEMYMGTAIDKSWKPIVLYCEGRYSHFPMPRNFPPRNILKRSYAHMYLETFT